MCALSVTDKHVRGVPISRPDRDRYRHSRWSDPLTAEAMAMRILPDDCVSGSCPAMAGTALADTPVTIFRFGVGKPVTGYPCSDVS